MKRSPGFLAAGTIFVLGIIIYWSTAYPSITWWDSSEYSAAAACLGITGAPGSLLLTISGWILSRVPWHDPAMAFNHLAGGLTALAVVLFLSIAWRARALIQPVKEVVRPVQDELLLLLASGIVICSATIWEYARMFTPYSLTALSTALIVLASLRWWRNAEAQDSWKYLCLVTFLLGLDFSVHRTNAVMIPGIVAMMILRSPRMFLNMRSYAAAAAGLCAGLVLQLLYIPMSMRDPPLNLGETNSISRWWDFVSLRQYGGNFLFDIADRNGPLWSFQIPHYVSWFGGNFFHPSSSTYLLGYAPAVLGLVGLGYLFTTNRRLAGGLVLLFILSVATSIAYFNIPENYFRSLHRHYLPTYALFSVFIFLGVEAIIRAVARLGGARKRIAALCSGIFLLGVSYSQYDANSSALNASGATFAGDHTMNVLDAVDRNGILFSSGDNDFFPERYVQIAAGVRRDVLCCNLSLLNLDWYLAQLQRQDSTFPLRGYTIDENRTAPGSWVTEHASIPLDPEVRTEYSTPTDTVRMTLPALRGPRWNLPQDVVLFDMIRANRWKRPIYFSRQSLSPELSQWLRPYLSDEGLVFKVVPDSAHPVNVRAVERTLERVRLRAYNDQEVPLDEVSAGVGNVYYALFIAVARARIEKGDPGGASEIVGKMMHDLPLERLHPGDETLREVRDLHEQLEKPASR